MTGSENTVAVNRRQLIQAGAAGLYAAAVPIAFAQNRANTPVTQAETYETQAKGIRTYPGMWRPHYPWEHIAWVSPKWPSQDYFWLDFPEAIFTQQGLLFLSHINPSHPTVTPPNLPAVQWQEIPGGIAYQRTIPHWITFGGKIVRTEQGVDLELFIRNNSDGLLNGIILQTCVYLRAIKEFAEYTADNKYVHVADHGWIPILQAQSLNAKKDKYAIGWRGGVRNVDLPVIVTFSADKKRLTAFTWFENTNSLITNPKHPCMHADPTLPDLQPGQSAVIYGKLLFFEGSLAEFDKALKAGRAGLDFMP